MDEYEQVPTEDTIIKVIKKSAAQRKTKRFKGTLNILDSMISMFIITPLTVGSWRGIWTIILIYEKYLPSLLSSCIGIFLQFIFCIGQNWIFNFFSIQQNKLSRVSVYVGLKLYICLFYFAVMLQWSGNWTIHDHFFNIEISPKGIILPKGYYREACVCFGIVVALLTVLKSIRNISGPPIIISMDYLDELKFPTYYKTKAGEKTSLYILDCLFSVLVVGTLVVFVWRGAWVLIDIFLFPENEKLSAWGSLVIGYVTVAIAFLMQPVMRWICDRATGAFRLFVADFFILFAFFGTVNVWRGIWNLLNLYFLPDNLELSCWITHWVCLIILLLLGCSNSLLVRGVYIDAEEPAGKCVVFPCYYLRTIFKYEKKNSSKLQLQENNKSQNSEKKLYENNHIVNIGSLENVIENHTKL